MDYSGRRTALQQDLATLEIDCALISALPNVRYLSGFTGSNAALLVARAEGFWRAHEVSPAVNNARSEGRSLIDPL